MLITAEQLTDNPIEKLNAEDVKSDLPLTIIVQLAIESFKINKPFLMRDLLGLINENPNFSAPKNGFRRNSIYIVLRGMPCIAKVSKHRESPLKLIRNSPCEKLCRDCSRRVRLAYGCILTDLELRKTYLEKILKE